jgi:hypothetical protein
MADETSEAKKPASGETKLAYHHHHHHRGWWRRYKTPAKSGIDRKAFNADPGFHFVPSATR